MNSDKSVVGSDGGELSLPVRQKCDSRIVFVCMKQISETPRGLSLHSHCIYYFISKPETNFQGPTSLVNVFNYKKYLISGLKFYSVFNCI